MADAAARATHAAPPLHYGRARRADGACAARTREQPAPCKRLGAAEAYVDDERVWWGLAERLGEEVDRSLDLEAVGPGVRQRASGKGVVSVACEKDTRRLWEAAIRGLGTERLEVLPKNACLAVRQGSITLGHVLSDACVPLLLSHQE